MFIEQANPNVRWLEPEHPQQLGDLGEVSASAGVSVGLLTLLVIGGVVYYFFLR
jgi:hypothetical protein